LQTLHFALDVKRCDECRSRVKIKKEIIVCAKPDCKFKKSELNKYCGKHQLCVFIDETTALGLKCCVNSIRGCRSQIPLDSTSRCPSCLKTDRVTDHAKRCTEIVKTETEKQCSVCCKMQPLDMFNGHNGETRTCKICRISNQRADAKREKEHVRTLANQNAQKPERKEVKPVQELRQIVKGNKLTAEEKKERMRIQKQRQRDALRKKYGDEEYKKLNAQKMAEQRKKKNAEN